MPLTATQSGSDFEYELAPEGNHVARCYLVVDMGVQQKVWKGEEKQVHQVRISWELPMALMDDGRPFSISRNYTLSLNEKSNLYQDLISWRGRSFTEEELQAFDLFTILGVPAMVSVIHRHDPSSGKTYANVASVTSVPQGLECPPQVNDTVKFSLEEYDEETFANLPDWLQQKVNRDEAKPQPVSYQFDPDAPNDDIPF